MRLATLFVTLLLVACGCPAKPSEPTQSQPAPGSAQPTPTTPPAPAPTTPPTAPPTTTPPPTTPGPGSGTGQQGSAAEPAPSWSGPGIGENCGAGDKCAKGLTCVAYYGIAGARGPQFKTCEVKCAADAQCPSGTKCVTVADGPGQVCRK